MRGLAVALAATIAVAPLASLVLATLTPPVWSWTAFALFKIGLSALLTLAVLPTIRSWPRGWRTFAQDPRGLTHLSDRQRPDGMRQYGHGHAPCSRCVEVGGG